MYMLLVEGLNYLFHWIDSLEAHLPTGDPTTLRKHKPSQGHLAQNTPQHAEIFAGC